MSKYNNQTFTSEKQAKQYKEDFQNKYNTELTSTIIKITESVETWDSPIAKGTIIETIDKSWDTEDYVINPLYNCGNYIYIPFSKCKVIC